MTHNNTNLSNVFHLYTDGNSFPKAKKSGFGGYIESPDGEIIVEFTEQIKDSHYVHSFELLGIIRGLTLAKEKKIENLISHCDDKTTILKLKEIFQDNIFDIKPNAKPELYQEIVDLSKNFKNIKFEYVPRSQNKYADSLSRRYADLMEHNYVEHYKKSLQESEQIFSTNSNPKRKLYFSHPSLIKNSYKNNPYMVAPYRNKGTRTIIKGENKKPYEYIYIERIVVNEEHTTFRLFKYNNDKSIIDTFETSVSVSSSDPKMSLNKEMIAFNQLLHENLTFDKKSDNHIWIYSNFKKMNDFFEQRNKLTQNEFPLFKQIFKDFNSFNSVFFHTLPFEHNFSLEIRDKEIKKNKLTNNLQTIEEIMEQIKNSKLSRDQNKHFGILINVHLKEYQNLIQRELNSLEKNEIIQSTANELKKIGIQMKIK